MQALIVSSSLDAGSRSERLARAYADCLTENGIQTRLMLLKDYPLPRFDNGNGIAADPSYRALHEAVSKAEGLVLAGPVYNWDSSAELKRFVEVVGTTPPDRSVRGAFFDKIVSFVSAAGLPHSYMAFSHLATSMMLDFKCIINPYQVYIHNRHWSEEQLLDEAQKRIRKSAAVMAELMRGLAKREYRSEWEI